MTEKEKYIEFCHQTYVPIYSQPWWLDAVCGEDNWKVWLYMKDDKTLAAMPYYMEQRGDFLYITKAPLTQNNGIIFKEDKSRKRIKQAKFEEEVINAACAYIKLLNIDVYEQQFQHTFVNWLPYSWHNYSCILRYSYIIEDTSDMSKVESEFSQDCRRHIRRGQKATRIYTDMDYETFYKYHELVFIKQGLKCPFSITLWDRLYHAVMDNYSGQIYCARDDRGNTHAVLFLVWDKKYVYHLLGGSMPEYTVSQAYAALTYHGIKKAHEMGLGYDFEGSMIERIAKAFRRYGGIPMPYYRIRKVFNPQIIRDEAEKQVDQLQLENFGGGYRLNALVVIINGVAA